MAVMREVRNGLFNKWLLLSALTAFFVLVTPCFELIFDTYAFTQLDYLYYMTFAESFSGLHPFAILFCMLPYAASFFDERKSGYTQYALLRAPRRRYIAVKMLAVSCAGAAALALPYIAVALIGVILFLPVTAQTLSGYYIGTLWEPIILGWGPGWVIAIKAGLMALFGAVWALPGLISASFFSTRLAVFVVPLVCYQALWTAVGSSLWFPMEYMIARSSLIPSLLMVLGRQMMYAAALVALCAISMNWRCKHA